LFYVFQIFAVVLSLNVTQHRAAMSANVLAGMLADNDTGEKLSCMTLVNTVYVCVVWPL